MALAASLSTGVKSDFRAKIMETFTSDTMSKMTSKPHMVYDPKPMAYKAVRVCFPTEIGHRPSNLVNPRQLATDDV